MTTNNAARQPAGIPSGGQFAATAHAEPDVTLGMAAGTAPVRNPEWHDAVETLVQAGKSPEEARCALATMLSIRMNQSYLSNAQQLLAAGRESDAAMLTIAFSSIKDLPARMDAAGNDQEKAREAVSSARKQLRSAGSMLDQIHHTGRQPIFRSTDEVLSDFESFLATDDPITNQTTPEGSTP